MTYRTAKTRIRQAYLQWQVRRACAQADALMRRITRRAWLIL